MGRPKALLPIQGRTFLENILAAISRTSIEDAIVVLGHHRDQIERNVSLPSVVFNADYEQGMITSFQTGIRNDRRQRHVSLRSEEHTSELQSHSDLVCRLLLE